MTNQAAQTMPDSMKIAERAQEILGETPDRERLAIRLAKLEFAALSQPAGVPKPEKIAPVQGYTPGIPWSMHLEAYDVYCKRYGKQQALIEGGCRGGFGTNELDMFIPGWRERLSEFNAMKARIAELEATLAAAPAASGGEVPPPNWCTTCQKHRNDPAAIFCSNAIHQEKHTPPAGASVSERAREDWMIVEAWCHGGVHAELKLERRCHPDEENEILALNGMRLPANLRALEQALTQQREEPIAYIESYEVDGAVRQGLVWADHPANTHGSTFTALYTTPQPGAEALRELVAEWKVRPGVTDAYKICADELESLLARGG